MAEVPALTLGTCLNLANSFLRCDQIWPKNYESVKEYSPFNQLARRKKNCQEHTNCGVEVPMVNSKSNFVCLVKSHLKLFWNHIFVLQVNDTQKQLKSPGIQQLRERAHAKLKTSKQDISVQYPMLTVAKAMDTGAQLWQTRSQLKFCFPIFFIKQI